MSTMSDVTVIRGGTIVDGTGAPGRRGDVAFADGVIIGVGGDLAAAHPDATIIDAEGKVVAPGFIDIHTHFDAQVFWDPALTPSCFHGVTTVVAGNCGFSIAPTRPEDRGLIANTLEKVEDMDPASLNAGIPWEFETFPEYLDTIERRGAALNYAAYIGHTALRIYVMGADASRRTAEPDEVEQMATLVREAVEAGACGFATSFAVTHLGADGQPIPSRWADRAEVTALCKAAAADGRSVISINGASADLHFADFYDLQLEVGVPFTYTAVLTTNTGAHMKAVHMHREGMAKGAQVWPQVSCRPLTFSMNLIEPFTLNTSPIFAELMPGGLDARRVAYADPVWRDRVRDGWDTGKGIPPRWDTYEVMESTAHPDNVGRKLVDIAAEAGKEPFDALLDISADETDLKHLRVKAVLANDDPEGVAMLLNEPGCTLGLSDAGAHVSQLCDAPLPTDLLGNWVRDRGVLSLEDAVHKLTKVQADIFGFDDRGEIAEGKAADLVVFDPTTVAPGPLRRVRDFPADAERLTADSPSGMSHVFVNGTPLVVDSELQDDAVAARPGRVLRPAH